MTNRFRVSTTLPRKLEELGLSPETVLRQAGLPMGLFNQEKILVSTEEFFALYRGIAEASNDPGFGLKVGTEERIEHYDPIKIAALSARSFRDAVQRKSVWLNEEMNARCSSFGFSRMRKSRRYWWTSVSHGLSASDDEALVARSTPSESSFREPRRTETSMRPISAAP